MKCYLCGSEIPDNAGMCNVCGAPVITDYPSNQQPKEQANAPFYQTVAPQEQYTPQPQQTYGIQGQGGYQNPQAGYQSTTPQMYGQVPYSNPVVYGRGTSVPARSSGLRTGALITGVVSSLLCLLSIFLPFFTVSAFGLSKSVALSAGADGWIVAGLAAVALLVVILARKSMGIGHIIFGGLLCAMAFIDGVKNKSDFDASRYGNMVSYGIGFYILLFGSIAIIVSGLLLILARQKEK